ncbi:hypothetical protein AB0H20_12620 [Nocardia fluminea]|uniref:hypothetical protein n=1 Tax=Nocardia fluminea TaxID=134984 RepID=UPI0033FFA0D8
MPGPLPPIHFEAPPVPATAAYSLYSAATIFEVDGPSRHLGGVNVRPYNCDEGFGTYSALMCDPAEPAIKAAQRALPGETFEPVVVWAADECAPDTPEGEIAARAAHTRTLHEPLLVESAFAARLLADAGAPTVVSSLAEGLGVLEEFLGEQGYNGYIHAARRWAVSAGNLDAANVAGAQLRTKLANSWVFGGGYGSVLGATLVATGPLYVWRNDPLNEVVTTGSHAIADLNNTVYGLSERIIVAGYECAIKAVTITP